jgi:hypothetical protein
VSARQMFCVLFIIACTGRVVRVVDAEFVEVCE